MVLQQAYRARVLPSLRAFLPCADGIRDDSPPAVDEASRVAQYLDQLRPEQHDVLKLSIYHGWSQQQIAEHLELPLGTVKTHSRRALIRIRELAARGEPEAAEGEARPGSPS